MDDWNITRGTSEGSEVHDGDARWELGLVMIPSDIATNIESKNHGRISWRANALHNARRTSEQTRWFKIYCTGCMHLP
jgi:hypothetical protein